MRWFIMADMTVKFLGEEYFSGRIKGVCSIL